MGVGSTDSHASGAYNYYTDGTYLRFTLFNSANQAVTFDSVLGNMTTNDTAGAMTLQTNNGNINDMDGSNRERADWGIADLDSFKTNLPSYESGKSLFYGVIQNAMVGTKTVGFTAGEVRTINLTLTPQKLDATGTYTLLVEAMQQGQTEALNKIELQFVLPGN